MGNHPATAVTHRGVGLRTLYMVHKIITIRPVS